MPTTSIQVDFLPQRTHGLPGRLGLTHAPGRWRPGGDPSSDRLLEEDLEQLRDRHGTRVLVTLLEEFEMARYAIPGLRTEVMRAGLCSLWLPIPDMSVPDSMEDVAALVTDCLDRMAAGDTVVVHCLGGLGRSGTIAACCLVERGREPEVAIGMVRRARPGAVEVASQVEFVTRFARARARGGS